VDVVVLLLGIVAASGGLQVAIVLSVLAVAGLTFGAGKRIADGDWRHGHIRMIRASVIVGQVLVIALGVSAVVL
jgi:hypothetical protein